MKIDKYSEKTQPIKPNNVRKNLGKFEADPTYKCKNIFLFEILTKLSLFEAY